jgi:CheY-like chemotaxis protein
LDLKDDHKRKLNILIAEDDEQSSQFLNILVESISKNIFSTVTGPETLALFKKNPDIDLILMDVQMPGMDGLEVTRQIRKFNKKIIIIAQTAFAMAADEEKALQAGCDAYLSKPLKKEKLMNLINRFF